MTDTTDIPQLDTVDAAIDALVDAPLLEVYRTLLPFDDGMVTAKAVKLALAGGGGSGGLPDWWTADNDALTVTVEFPSDPDGGYVGLTVKAPAEFDGFIGVKVEDSSETERTEISFDHLLITNGAVSSRLDRGFAAFSDGAGDDIVLIATHTNDEDRTQDIVQFYKSSGAAGLWGVNKDGFEYFQNVLSTGPADDDLLNSQRVHWYDDTEDAPALRFKQRDIAGNLTSGKAAGLTTDGTAFRGVAKPDLPTSPTGAEIAAVLDTLALVNLT